MNFVKVFEQMCRMRSLEAVAYQSYLKGDIQGFCHLYSGQEAVAAGVQCCLNAEKDDIITGYRSHCTMLSCGSSPESILGELMGKSIGCSGGKGGSMHIFDLKNHFYGGHGIVGAQISLGTGIAFAHKYNKDDGVTFAYMGDGAINQGQVHESFNMAALWNLPIVYIIENNQYAMGTSVERASAVKELYKRGQSSGIEGVVVDGMNVIEVIEKSKKVIESVRSGFGPMLMEMVTYRYRGHSMSDPGNYRSRDEVKNMKDEKDPIDLLESYIIDNDITSSDECDSIRSNAYEEMKQIAELVKNSPFPDNRNLYTNVYG